MKTMSIEEYREWQARSKPLSRGNGMKRGKAIRKRPKPGGLKAAKETAWRAFSLLIRTRDCLRTTGTKERGVCCTCGHEYPFGKLQAGHFIPGRRNSNLWDERGVHAQCYLCNCNGSGQPAAYEAYMLEHYGKEVIDELREQNQKSVKFTVEEYRAMTDDFTRRRFVLK